MFVLEGHRLLHSFGHFQFLVTSSVQNFTVCRSLHFTDFALDNQRKSCWIKLLLNGRSICWFALPSVNRLSNGQTKPTISNALCHFTLSQKASNLKSCQKNPDELTMKIRVHCRPHRWQSGENGLYDGREPCGWDSSLRGNPEYIVIILIKWTDMFITSVFAIIPSVTGNIRRYTDIVRVAANLGRCTLNAWKELLSKIYFRLHSSRPAAVSVWLIIKTARPTWDPGQLD